MAYFVQCVPATDGVPVNPCGTIGGVAHVPAIADVAGTSLDPTGAAEIFIFFFTGVMLCWVTGLGVGAIIRVIRSA